MFESDFAKTEYIEKDNVVFHVWKKEAHFDDYRDPVKASLELLREHKDSVFIVDARNGFEDVKEPTKKLLMVMQIIRPFPQVLLYCSTPEREILVT